MPVAELYRRQAALLVSVVPFVAVEKSFALKGGTAINLFVRDLPRISVDLDLAYPPVAGRDTSLTAIDAALRRVSAGIAGGIRGSRVDEVAPKGRSTHHEAERADGRRPDTNRSHTRLAGMRLRSGSPRRFSAGRRGLRLCGNSGRFFSGLLRRQDLRCARSPASARSVLCLKFNGWRFQGFEEAKSALIEGIVTGYWTSVPL
jgi:hypothetical protein